MVQISGIHQLRLVVYPIIIEFYTIYIPTGAGFLPSTVAVHFKSATGSTWPFQRNSNSYGSQLFNSIVTQLDVRFVPGSSTDLSGLWHKGKDFRAPQVETYVVSSNQLNFDISYGYMVIYAITQVPPQNRGVHEGYWPLCNQPLHSPKLTAIAPEDRPQKPQKGKDRVRTTNFQV